MKRILLASAAVVSVWTGVVWQHPTHWLDDLNVGQVMLVEPAEAALQSEISSVSPTLACSDLSNGTTICNAASILAWDTIITTGSVIVPASVTANTLGRAICAGGGGGGGGTSVANQVGVPGAGGAVGTVTAVGLFTAGATITPTIGAGGTLGAAGVAGGAGGDTTLILNATTYTAHGGAGGVANQASGGSSAGGTATGWTDNQPGMNGNSPGGSQQVGGGNTWSVANIQAAGTATAGVAPATGAIGVGGTGGRSNSGGTSEAGAAGVAGACRFTANGQ